MDDADSIKFSCKHCGGKIRVLKIHAGKKGRCPKCDHVITIPYESAAIELLCKNCGLKISVPQNFKGKDGFCPKCKSPVATQAEQETKQRTRLVGAGGNLTLLDVPEEYKIQESPTEQPAEMDTCIEHEIETDDEHAEQTESIERHSLPWFIDIFLYPMSLTGLLHLGIFIGIPFLIEIAGILLGPLRTIINLPAFIVDISIGLYMYWYFSECVRDSAKGGTRAPDAFAIVDLGEMLTQMLYIISCCVIFFAPVGIYYSFTQNTKVFCKTPKYLLNNGL